MKNVILSFDYELFFGVNSGTVLNSLVIPTNLIMDAMEKNEMHGNFFVDVLMIKYLKKNNDQRSNDDLYLIESQLRDIVKRGHRIELHLHPHWVDAKYNGDGTWDFSNYRHYMLSTFDEGEIIKMFTEGVDYLNAIGSKEKPNYKVCAFRAGGWAIQPFDRLKKAFLSCGIVVDSSSAFGFHNELTNSSYDFRNIPHKSIYRFNEDVCKEEIFGHFIEVPITTYRMSVFNYVKYKFIQKKYEGYQNRLTDGTHERSLSGIYNKKSFISRFLDRFRCYRMLTFSQEYPFVTTSFIKKTILDYYCFIDHPKDYSKFTTISINKLGGMGCRSLSYLDIIKRFESVLTN